MASVWTLDTALALIRLELEPALATAGYHCALAGSVLLSGASSKDLDVLVFPHTSGATRGAFEIGIEDVHRALRRIDGMAMRIDADALAALWLDKGSTDRKHVEIWSHRGRRVDIFIVR